jgi:hypothetical protein
VPSGLPISHSWPKGIDEAPYPPAMLLRDRVLLRRACGDRLPEHHIWIVDRQQQASRGAAEFPWHQPLSACPGCSDPERWSAMAS